MNNSTSEAVVVYDDLQCLTLTPTTTLSDVVTATIHDISVEDVSDTTRLDQYLGSNGSVSFSDDQILVVDDSDRPNHVGESCQYQSSSTSANTNDNLGSTNSVNQYNQLCLYETPTSVMVTPTTKHQADLLQSTPHFSPMADNRFNDSLTGLLGSPQPHSPLASHPFFSDLQSVLANDCKSSIKSMPDSLMNSMTTQPQPDVFYREQLLQRRFTKLETRFPQDIKQLSNFYRYQAAIVETDRFRSIHQQSSYSTDYQRSLNRYFDTQLHQIMERVEKSLSLLEESTTVVTMQHIKQRPHLSKRAIRLMEDWYEKHLEHPYPTGTVIDDLANQGNVTIEQVKKWFANKRNRCNNTRTLTEIARQKRRRAMQNVFLT